MQSRVKWDCIYGTVDRTEKTAKITTKTNIKGKNKAQQPNPQSERQSYLKYSLVIINIKLRLDSHRPSTEVFIFVRQRKAPHIFSTKI